MSELIRLLNLQPWMLSGLCAERAEPDYWFPAGLDELDRRPSFSTRAAIEICDLCPVREECLDYALDQNIRHGIWGGKTTHDRLKMREAA